MDYLDSEIISYPTPDTEKTYTIYKATNLVNGKCYIGYTNNFEKRKREHIGDSFNPTRNNYQYLFYTSIRKYGIDNWNWEVLWQSNDAYFTLNCMEGFYINKYRSYIDFNDCNGYNLTMGGGILKLSQKSSEQRCKTLSDLYKNNILKNNNYKHTRIREPRTTITRTDIQKRAEKYIYKIINKEDQIEETRNLRQFCRKYNLDRRHLRRTYNKYSHHLGFRIISKEIIAK